MVRRSLDFISLLVAERYLPCNDFTRLVMGSACTDPHSHGHTSRAACTGTTCTSHGHASFSNVGAPAWGSVDKKLFQKIVRLTGREFDMDLFAAQDGSK